MAENKNHRALRDIGNQAAVLLVPEIADKKITRPVTRSFRAQLLASGQATADKKQICVKVTWAPAVVKNVRQKQPAATVKPKPAVKEEEVINIESDNEEEPIKSNSDKNKILKESKKKKKKKKVQNFTSIRAVGGGSGGGGGGGGRR